MYRDSISLNDYAGLNGFGWSNTQEVNELTKALSAGYAADPSQMTGGAALRVESLEASLKVVTFTNRHIKFWKKIPKSPAYSTVEEFNVLSQYGNERAFGFTREGELPPSQDSTFSRQTALVKFIGTTRTVTHQMTLVNPAHGDVIALENQNGILWLLERVEDSLFHGNSALSFSGESTQWDGLDTLIDSTSIIDLEGQPLQESVIEEASNQVIEQFGYPTDLFLGTRAMSDLVKTFYPRERVQLPAPADGKVGLSINTMATQAGVMEFNPGGFIKKGNTPPALATSNNAPGTPVAAIAAAAGAGTANWAKSFGTGFAGNQVVEYAVTACNRFGESAPAFTGIANGTISAAQLDDSRQVEITNAAAGTNAAEYFIVYRRDAGVGGAASLDLSLYSEVGRIATTSQAAGVAAATFQDLNTIMPGTEMAYLGELTPSVLTFRQLAPLMKMDLAVLAPAYRWMILMYGVPILFAPQKWVRLINVGRLS